MSAVIAVPAIILLPPVIGWSGGAAHIGEKVEVEVSGAMRTSIGRSVFARLEM